MTREEFLLIAEKQGYEYSLFDQVDSCHRVDFKAGAQWAFDLLQKQHEEEVKELVIALQKIEATDDVHGIHQRIAHNALSAHRARQQASGEGRGE